jgi:FkbM family methyltransferase
MNIKLAMKGLLPYIKRMEFGKAFSIAFHQLDHYINITVLKKREVIRKVNNYPMILNFDEEGLSKHLMIHREREVAETETVKRIVKPGMCILEIGANVGYYTILMGKLVGKGGKIYAYEPYPSSVDILTRNVKLNNLTDIVQVHNLAVSNENAIQKLYLGRASNVHSLINYKTDDNDADYIEIKTRDIREIMVSASRKFDLIRMDIEGHERELFNRLSNDIKAFLPARIFFEVHPLGTSYLYDDIKTSDLLKVAARRPKMTRAILLNREA